MYDAHMQTIDSNLTNALLESCEALIERLLLNQSLNRLGPTVLKMQAIIGQIKLAQIVPYRLPSDYDHHWENAEQMIERDALLQGSKCEK